MKKRIRLTESDLHRIVKESVNRMLKEVSLKGKSGEEYSLHGDNFDSWGTLAKLRKHQLNTPNRIMTGREKDAYKRDDDNSMQSMIDFALMNNIRGSRANRLVDIADKTSDYISKDIINNYDPKVESKQHNGNKHTVRSSEANLHRIVKESVKKIINEVGDTNRGQYMLGRLAAKKNAAKYYNTYAPEIQRAMEKRNIGKYANEHGNGSFGQDIAFSHGYTDYDHDNHLGAVSDKYNRYKNQDSNPILQTVGELRHMLHNMLNIAYRYRGNAPIAENEIEDMLNMSKQINDYYNNEQSTIIMNKLQGMLDGESFDTGDVVTMDRALAELEKQ